MNPDDPESWRAWREKARAEWRRLHEIEAKLDAKLAGLPTWSGKWWHVLKQIDIVRGQQLYIRRMILEINYAIAVEESAA